MKYSGAILTAIPLTGTLTLESKGDFKSGPAIEQQNRDSDSLFPENTTLHAIP